MGKKSRGSPGLYPGEQLQLRQRYAHIILGADAPVIHRVTEQLLDHGGDGFSARVLQDAFAATRAGDPHLTPERFLARLDPSSMLGQVVTALLGPASATLIRTLDRVEFEDALIKHYDDFRYSAPPYDGGVSYGSHRYLDGTHVDLRDTRLLVLPANAPRFDRNTGLWLYPDYNVQGRPRLNRSVAAVQGSRVWGREIPLDKKGKELFDALEIEHSIETFDNYLDAELRQSRLQIAFTLSTGNSPIYRSAIEVPGQKFTGLGFYAKRNAEQARWELAARLGSHILDPATDLSAAWKSLPTRRGGKRPTEFIPHDAFSRLSRDELFEVALELPTAPGVRLNTFEWEHHRSQRFTKRMLSIVEAMGLDAVWKSRFTMLTGLCEPENLHFLPPWMHAREDFFAGGFAPDWSKVWVAGEFKTEAFRANRARMNRWGSTLAGADFAKHPDLQRVKDVLVAYEPRHVIALLSELQLPDVRRAASKLRGSGRAAWKGLVDQLNQAADVYGISPTLRLPKP